MLIDAATLTPGCFYHTNLTSEVDAAGNLSTITLTIPAGTRMPAPTKDVVVIELFPLYEEVWPQHTYPLSVRQRKSIFSLIFSLKG